MADETVDFVEEMNGDVKYWYSYENIASGGGESADVNGNNEIFRTTYTIVKDSAEEIVEDSSAQCADVVLEEEEEVNIENEYMEDVADADDFSKHNLILKESINEEGVLTESYFCQECLVEYSDINEFLVQHPGVELLNDKPEDEEVDEDGEIEPMPDTQVKFAEESSQHKLWDLVENIVEEENSEENILPNSEFNTSENDDESHIESDIVSKSEVIEADNEHYYCYECQQVFTDLQTAEEHDCTQPQPAQEDEESQEKELEQLEHNECFTCAFCRQLFNSYEELLNHSTNCDQNLTLPLTKEPANAPTFHCDLCNKDYLSLRSYNNHKRLHKKVKIEPTPQGPTKCSICNTKFESTKNLKLHMKMHKERTIKTIQEALPAGAQTEYNELNQFFCEICNKSFDQRLLTIHKNMHQNVEEYNCSKCNKQFENSVSYEMHLQMHNETQGKSNKQTIAPDLDLLGNDTSQGVRKKHACQYCGKEFQRPYEKVKHERIHTGEKPYNCEVCGKTFRVSYSLTLHLRTHTDIRPYVCATCNKRFKQQSVYVHHLKTHIAERQYKCDLCGKSFRTSVQLCGHKNSHKKPFNCTECNRPFASMYAVKIHMKTHNKTHKANKNLKNRCDICGASYARLFALRYHLKDQHGIDIDPEQLLGAAEHSSSLNDKDMDVETALLMNAASEAQLGDEHNGEMIYMNNDNVNVGGNLLENGMSQGETINDDDLDETVAATQTILQNEEIIVDNFHPEEIIADWLK